MKKFLTQKLFKKYSPKKVDGKNVYLLGSKNKLSLKLLNKIYKRIPDDKRIPVVIESKEQYLKEYIKNQEHIKHYKFPQRQKQKYLKENLKEMQPVTSRYTTKHNKYIEPRVVLFSDRQLSPSQLKANVYHEYGHEVWENRPQMRTTWRKLFSPKTSPTIYGITDKEEDFSETMSMWQDNSLLKYKNNPQSKLKPRFQFLQKQKIDGDSRNKQIINDESKDMVRVIFSPEEKKEMKKVGLDPKLQAVGYEQNLYQDFLEDIDNAEEIKSRKDKESKNMAFKYPEKLYGRKRLTVPVSLLYKMRGKYNIETQKTKFPHYVEQDRIEEEMINEQKRKNEDYIKSLTPEQKEIHEELWLSNVKNNPNFHGPLYPREKIKYPTKKQIGQRWAEQQKPLIESETGIRVGKPIVIPDKQYKYSSNIAVKFPLKRTKEQMQKEIDYVMQPKHRTDKFLDFGTKEEAEKYTTELSEAIASPEPLVEPIELEDYNIRKGEIGEGRHRIVASKRGGLKEIDIIVPENTELKGNKLVLVDDHDTKNKQSLTSYWQARNLPRGGSRAHIFVKGGHAYERYSKGTENIDDKIYPDMDGEDIKIMKYRKKDKFSDNLFNLQNPDYKREYGKAYREKQKEGVVPIHSHLNPGFTPLRVLPEEKVLIQEIVDSKKIKNQSIVKLSQETENIKQEQENPKHDSQSPDAHFPYLPNMPSKQCPKCKGLGYSVSSVPNSPYYICPQCGGLGEIK